MNLIFLHDLHYSQDPWMEINYALKENWPMENAIQKPGWVPWRRNRVHEKKISKGNQAENLQQ